MEGFITYKPLIFLLAFAGFVTIQSIRPFKNSFQKNLKAWPFNLMLGLVNSLVIGSLMVALPFEGERYGPLWQILLCIPLLDCLAYMLHRIYHWSSLMWRFHRLHHGDRNFDTTTAVRFHTVEVLTSFTIRLGVISALGLPLSGVVAFEVCFLIANLFQHSDFNLPAPVDRLISRIFVTPSYHRLHHSILPEYGNRHFSTIFTAWDWIFRTQVPEYPRELKELGDFAQ